LQLLIGKRTDKDDEYFERKYYYGKDDEDDDNVSDWGDFIDSP
jgi:hypothetical protein